ncbi:MAG TPA: AMP-binding protein [Legionella sp.]|nr:AMP-binding protein [Legionella sp.]
MEFIKDVIDFVTLLEKRAELYPHKIIYRFIEPGTPVQTITYKQLYERVSTIAVALDKEKLIGQRAILVYPPGFEFIAALLGCFAAHVIAVPSYPPVSKRTAVRLKNIISDCSAQVLLTTENTYNKIQRNMQHSEEQFFKNSTFICTDSLPDEKDNNLPKPKLNEIGFLQYTSGSTGGIKGVMVSHHNLYHNSLLIKNSMVLDEDDIMFNWLPQFHDMGLIGGILQPLFSNFEDVLISPFEFIKNPSVWVKSISEYRVTISGGPNFAYQLCVQNTPDACLTDLDLSTWRTAFNGAEPISSKTINSFSDRFEPCGFNKSAFYCCYGMAETTLFVVGNHLGQSNTELFIPKNGLSSGGLIKASDKEDSECIVSSGIINKFEKVLIVDPETLVKQPENQVGEIWVQGDSNATGYWGKDKELLNKSVFNAYTTDNQGPFLRTGDLGLVHEGHLFVTGRIKDLIIIRGENFYPHPIEEAVAAAHPRIRTGCVVAVGIQREDTEKLIVIAELKPAPNEDFGKIIAQINAHVSEECDVRLHEIHLVRAHSLLKTSSGKLQRQASKNALMQGGFKVLYTWSSSLVEEDEESSHPLLSVSEQGIEESLTNWLREYGVKRINPFIMDERRCIPPHIMLHFAQKGLFGLQIPKSMGGLGLNFRQSFRLLEQISAINLSLGIFVGLANSNIYPLFRYGNSSVREKYIPLLAQGHDLAAFALTEPAAGSDVHQIQTTAKAVEEGGWIINGTKCLSGSAAWSGIINVFAKAYDHKNQLLGITAFAVPTDLPGIRQGDESITMGLKAMSQNHIHFENVYVAPEYILGRPGEGLVIAEETLTHSRLGMASLCLGAMKRCVQIATRFSQHRTIATGLLVENPLWIKRINDMYFSISATEYLLQNCIDKIDNGEPLPVELALVNKLLSTEFLWKITDQCMQVLGGRGYLEINGIAQIMRDARVMRIFEGTSEVLFDYLGALVLEKPDKLTMILNFLQASNQVQEEFTSFPLHVKEWKEQALEIVGSSGITLLRYHLGVVISYISLYAALPERADSDTALWAKTLWKQELDILTHNIAHKEPRLLFNKNSIPYEQSIGWLEQSFPGQMEQSDDPIFKSGYQKTERGDEGKRPSSLNVSLYLNEEKEGLLKWIGNWLHQKRLIPKPIVDTQKALQSLGLDSIHAVSLVHDLEDYLHCSLPVDLVYECRTVDQLLESALKMQNKWNTVASVIKDVNYKPLIIRESWLSTFLDHGYQEETLQLTSMVLNSKQITALIDVTRYFMPSDKMFHLNIFNCKVALIQMFTTFVHQYYPADSVESIQLQELTQSYIKPIRISTNIPIFMEMGEPQSNGLGFIYEMDFSVMDGAFRGKAVFFIQLKQNVKLISPVLKINLKRSAIAPIIPDWMNSPYETINYKIRKTSISPQGIKAEIESNNSTSNKSHLKLTNTILPTIYTAQLGVIFACWDNQLEEKHGEFYLMKHHEKRIQSISPAREGGIYNVHMKLNNKTSNFNRIIYTMNFTIEGLMSGEVVYAIPVVKKE